ncbi:hypothetical protein PSTG_01480 [Puccinia striiformis f. sp. tritici PST-78]|uniref:DUF659 domain-containing protein n=1 Tax=Puccinia striiformis f. sp. tritici PST-78 TaxID=1165861 RepID=A0A0L0W170_9BASI|nr:hypothetical protein PSTG_01480 [Puccinia striiformis f. sp. tritici PST-78]
MARPRKRIRKDSVRTDKTKGPTLDSDDKQDEDPPNDSTATTPSATPRPPDTTDEERLEHARDLARKRNSLAYVSYEPPELLGQLDKYKRRMIAWPCKICGKPINRPTYNTSCGNLLTHAGRCEMKQKKGSGSKTLACVGVTGTADLDPRETASPFPALQQISHQRILHPTIVKNLPTRKMVSKGIYMLYLSIQEAFCHELKIHKGVDAWQSPQGFDIIGAVIYRLKEDKDGKTKLDAMPLDFVQLDQSHTGKYLAQMLQYIGEKFGRENQICGIVSDNASNNKTMIEELRKLKWKRFKGEPQWIQCFAHVLNLVVKAILRPFGPPKKKTCSASDDDESNNEEEAEHLIAKFDDKEDSSESEDEEESADEPNVPNGQLDADDELTLEDIHDLEDEDDEDVYTSLSCRHTLAKFRAIATKLRKSPNSKAKFVKLCEETKCNKPHNIECDFLTRWNSTYKQVASIVRCEKAILTWQHDKQYGTPQNTHLVQADMDLAQDLLELLEPFYKCTLQVIAMVLHPSFKDEYFKLAKWPKEWINEAISSTREMFDLWYKPQKSNTTTKPPATGPPKQPPTMVLVGLGAAAIARSAEAISDPIDIWLSGGLVLEDGAPVNALKWWIEQKHGGNTHHGLLQMALDVMCCPG